MSIYDFTGENSKGEITKLSDHVAGKCGYIKQYEPLQALYKNIRIAASSFLASIVAGRT
jgi:glutathione peroxidase-family protein